MRVWDYATTRPIIILAHGTPHLPPALSASFNFWSSDTYSQYFIRSVRRTASEHST